MQTDNPILDDLAKLVGGAAGTMHGVKREIETAVKVRIERLVAELELVPREEFEVVRDMVRQARQENEALRVRVEELEVRLADKNRTKKPPKTAPKKSKK